MKTSPARKNAPVHRLSQKQRVRASRTAVREMADQAFSRAAGAPLIAGNTIELLRDAAENYPAWLTAIANAKRYIHFESYIIHEDEEGWKFAEALIAKAKEGVRVRLVYDWLGGFGKTSRSFWKTLVAGGVEVRCYNPPRWDSPLSLLSRDHRKTLTVDGRIAFITGLCVGQQWVGIPEKGIEPWRDTGVAIEGPAVADVEQAFAYVWDVTGTPLPKDEVVKPDALSPAGDISLRVVATIPVTAGMMRADLLVAALARNRLWLTDAYYAGTTSYVQALNAAVKDGVDVRLLLPNATDITVLKPLSRAGYRPLLDAGVRVFEWNGTMLHAKTAVADSRWARVGSTNLNIASWFGNCEIDAIVENEAFAREMEETYLDDLTNATEVVLDARHRVRVPGRLRHPYPMTTSGGGSGGRVAAGALRIGNAIGAAFAGKRVLEPVEARLMLIGGLALLFFAALFTLFPRVLVYPIVFIFVWFAAALFYSAYKLYRSRDQQEVEGPETAPTGEEQQG